MMGAGKSSIGRALAELSERTFVDTDLLLQHRLGRPVPQIFQVYGEEAFRDHETSVLRSLEAGDSVISTGGGIILRDENWDEFSRLGTTVFLDAKFETLIERLASSKKKRPLLQVDDWESRTQVLLDSRIHLYRKADLTVRVDDVDLTGAAERVLTAITDYENDANRP